MNKTNKESINDIKINNSLEEIYNKIIQIKSQIEEENINKKRILIGISGIPGSGKTTFSKELNNYFKEKQNQNEEKKLIINPIVIPFDGYHIYKEKLTEEQLKFRGRIDTFDLNSFEEKLKEIKETTFEKKEFYFPSFDHKLKDPIENDIKITKEINLLIFEGLYLLINNLNFQKYFDLCVYIDADLTNSMDRVAKRNFEAGISLTLEDSIKRADFSDKKNALFVMENSLKENIMKIKFLD